MSELRLGDWREVLADVEEVDAVICDPPYGDRTHKGNANNDQLHLPRRVLSYGAWTPEDVREFVAAWAPRCRSWIVAMTSDDLIPVWREAYREARRYDFAPVGIVSHNFRHTGDGPASGLVYMMVSRPRGREFMGWRSLPGFYLTPRVRGGHIGGKPIGLMRAIVRDYSRPGDLVVDPCAGYGTTLRAAVVEGRRAIGAEIDPATFAEADKRLALPFTPRMCFDVLAGDQGELL